MRIAIVISQTPPIASGVARIAARLEAGLQRRGHKVDVFSASRLPRLFLGEFRFVNALPLLREILERGPYDVINIYGPVPTFSDVMLLFLAASRHRLHGARIIYSHVWDVEISRMANLFTWVYNLGTRLIARLADYVVVSNQSHHDDLARFVPADRVRTIPWGVDDYFICPSIPRKADEFTILFVGQLRPYKGVDILLRAFAHLEACRLIIVGDGHCRDKYIRLAKTLGLQNVVFKGRVSDEELRNLYNVSHVIVLPSVSRLEAFGIVLLEGMGAGCVPVASNLPGVRDTVGDAGFTFEVGDASSLAHALGLLKTDYSLVNRLSRLAWSRAQTYSWDATCQGYLSAFADVCQRELARQVQHIPLLFLTELRFPDPL